MKTDSIQMILSSKFGIQETYSKEQLQVMNVFDAIQNNGWSPDIPIGKSEVQQY